MDSTTAGRVEGTGNLGNATLNRIFALLLTTLLCAVANPVLAQPEENARATLISATETLQPGQTQWIALKQEIRKGWHTYWRYPGDSGAAPVINWQLPEGVSISAFHWPYPERMPYGPLMNYGYHDEVILPMEISLVENFTDPEVSLSGSMTLLVCAEICIPEQKRLQLTLPVSSDPVASSPHNEDIQAALLKVPQPFPIPATYQASEDQLSLSITLGEMRDDRIQEVTFFPYEDGVIENPAKQRYSINDGQLVMSLVPGWDFQPDKSSLAGVVVIREQEIGRAHV